VETTIQEETGDIGFFELNGGTTSNNDIIFRYYDQDDCPKIGFWDYSASAPVLDIGADACSGSYALGVIRPANTRVYYHKYDPYTGANQVWYFDTENPTAGPVLAIDGGPDVGIYATTYSDTNEKVPFRDYSTNTLSYFDYVAGITPVDTSGYDDFEFSPESGFERAYQGSIIPLKVILSGDPYRTLAYIDESGSVVETTIQEETEVFGISMGWFEIHGTTTNNEIVFRYWSHTDGCARVGLWDTTESDFVETPISDCDGNGLGFTSPVNTRVYYHKYDPYTGTGGIWVYDTDTQAPPAMVVNMVGGIELKGFSLTSAGGQEDEIDGDGVGDACDCNDGVCYGTEAPFCQDPTCGPVIAGNWTGIGGPEGVYEPPTVQSGTHLNAFTIKFAGLNAKANDTINCDVLMSDGSVRLVSGVLTRDYNNEEYDLSYSVQAGDVIDAIQPVRLWWTDTCRLEGQYTEQTSMPIYAHLNTWTSYYSAGDDAYEALKCWAPFANHYFENTVKCDFDGDVAFALTMSKGFELEGICDDTCIYGNDPTIPDCPAGPPCCTSNNEVDNDGDGVANCDDPECWGISYDCVTHEVI
jgi:hypothetical protein